MKSVVGIERGEVMNQEHQKVIDFVKCMLDPHSCDRLGKDVDLNYPCDHSLRFTRRLLETFPEVNIEKTLEHFKEQGGICDCKVISNVIPKLEGDPEPLTEEEEYEADLWFAIEFLFWYWREQGLTGDQIKQKVVSMATDFSDHFSQLNQGGE